MGLSIKKDPTRYAFLMIGEETYHVKKLGQGRYCTAWKAEGDAVYLQVHEKDFSKEILAGLAANPHLPRVKSLGWLDGNVPYRIYQTVEYMPLTAQHKKAWAMYKLLHEAMNNAHTSNMQRKGYMQRSSLDDDAQHVKEAIRGQVETFFPDSVIWEAINALVDRSYDYGAYTLEIVKRNCAVDPTNGELILLDPLFDLAEVREQWEKRRKAHAY